MIGLLTTVAKAADFFTQLLTLFLFSDFGFFIHKAPFFKTELYLYNGAPR